MAIRFFPSRREMRRVETRLMLRFFTVMAVVTVLFVAIVAVHYLLG
jgi:hypothetical protein